MLSKVLSTPDDSIAAANDAVAKSTEITESEQRSSESTGNINGVEEIIRQTRVIRFARTIGSIELFGFGLVDTKLGRGILANER